HSTLQLRATMSAIRHPCLIMGQCPSNFEGRNTLVTAGPALQLDPGAEYAQKFA
ncbi:MAG: hypothetical protein BECKG1743F_GA0114225_103374, partial [Candidatus Kentron sp. G]